MSVVIFAEKEDMGAKIAAALDKIVLPGGAVVTSDTLSANAAKVKQLQASQGYIPITFHGEKAFVTWGLGHLYALKDVFEYDPAYKRWASRPVCFIPPRYELHPITSPVERFAKKNDFQRSVISKLFRECDHIINSTDDDREGEVIFAYVYEANQCKKPYERVHFTSTNKEDIVYAFDHLIPSAAVKPIEMAGRARGIYDFLVGSNCTVQVTLKNPGMGVCSVGRVQTATLNMLVEREDAITAFASKPFWSVKATFTEPRTGNDFQAEHKTKRFDTKAAAVAVLNKVNGKPGVVTDVKEKKIRKEVPMLYSQTTLQMDANEAFGYTPDQTLNICQWLYENGYATYPRTKSVCLNDGMEKNVIEIITALRRYGDMDKYIDSTPLNPGKKFFDSKKVESHYAIIPTTKLPPATLTAEQANIYGLIAKSVIRTIYPDAWLKSVTVTVDVDGEAFTSTGTSIAAAGWMKVDAKSKETFLPDLTLFAQVDGKEYKLTEGKTEPPKRYTDKSLLGAMVTAGKDLEDEELRKILADPSIEGIGTDSTRAGILKTLIDREYAYRKGKAIIPTQKGIDLIHRLPIQDLRSPAFTAKMEKRLTQIAHGEDTFNNFISDIEAQVQQWCEAIHASPMYGAAKVPVARASIRAEIDESSLPEPPAFSKKPAVIVAAFDDTAPVKKKKSSKQKTCPSCGMNMTLREGKFGKFWSCSGYPTCRKTEPYVDPKAIKCPECGKGRIVEKTSAKTGKTFWACSNYPDCKKMFWDKPDA